MPEPLNQRNSVMAEIPWLAKLAPITGASLGWVVIGGGVHWLWKKESGYAGYYIGGAVIGGLLGGALLWASYNAHVKEDKENN